MKVKNILAVALGAVFLLGGCSGGGKEACEHEWSTWETETAPTCTKEGTEKRSCPKCGKEERQKIPPAEHKWGEWNEKEAPTCTQNGMRERECAVCHTKETKELDRLGHAERAWKSDGEGHWKECPVCEETLTEKEPHTAENGKCTVCGGEVRGLEFAVYENECHVIGIGTESGNITIPAIYCGKPVTEIAQSAFYNEDITSVVVSDSVEYIRASAIADCSSLSRVQLGRSVKEIEASAFNWDQKLSEINLPASLKIIGQQAFSDTKLTQIEFPSSLQSIGDYAFSSAPLQDVTVPGSVTEIGFYAFGLCESLESIRFEKGIKALPNLVCTLCGKLASVSLPEGLETIGSQAFSGCSKLTQIAIPSSVRELCEGAFQQTGLSEVTILDTVQMLGDAVF